MNTHTKLALSAACLAIIGSTAFADDPQLQNRLAAEHAQNPSSALQTTGTTVAVYAGGRGISQNYEATRDDRSDLRFELRMNAHGQLFGAYAESR